MKKTALCFLLMMLLGLFCFSASAEETAIVLDVKGLIPTQSQAYETIPLYVCFDVYQDDTYLGTAVPGDAFILPEAGKVTFAAQADTVPSSYITPENMVVEAQNGVTVHTTVLLTARKGYFSFKNCLEDGTALPGGAFTVLDENGAEVLHFSCDENGSFGPDGALLPEGNYTVKQSWAGEGSIFNNNSESFSIVAPQNIQTPSSVTFVNAAVPDGSLTLPDLTVQTVPILPDPKNGDFSFDVNLTNLMPAGNKDVQDITVFASFSSPDAKVTFTGATVVGAVNTVRCMDENGSQIASLRSNEVFPAGTAGVEITITGALTGDESITLHCTAGKTTDDARDAILSLQRSWHVGYLNQSGTGYDTVIGGQNEGNITLPFEDGRARLAFDTLANGLIIENVSSYAAANELYVAVMAPVGSLSASGCQLLHGEETDIAIIQLNDTLAPGETQLLPVSISAGAQVLVMDKAGSLSSKGETTVNALLDAVWQQKNAKYYVYILDGESTQRKPEVAASGTLLRGNGQAQAGILLLALDEFGSGAYAVTDDVGTFTFYGLSDEKTYALTAVWPEGMWPLQMPETIKAGEKLECVFGQDTILTGTVLSSEGIHVSGAVVKLFSRGQEIATMVTDETGKYFFTGINESNLRLAVTLPDGAIGLTDGTLASPFTAEYTVNTLEAESTNTLDVQAVRLCSLTFEEEKNVAVLQIISGNESISLFNGETAFLLPGEYSFTYQIPEGYLLSGKEISTATLTDVRQLTLNARLAKEAGVSLALPNQRVLTFSGMQQTTATLNETGLWPGNYAVTIALDDKEYLAADENWQQDGNNAVCSFTLSEGEKKELSTPDILRFGTITGSVSGDHGVTILAVNEDGRLLETVSDVNGSYAFINLPAGSYTITAKAQNGLAAARVLNNTLVLDGSGSNVSGPDFVMQASAKLVVEAFHDDNMNGGRGVYEARMSGLVCRVTDENGVLLAQGVTGGAEGMVNLEGLTPGKVNVSLTLPDGYAFAMPSEKTGRGFSPVPCVAGVETTYKMTLSPGDTSYLTVGMVESATVNGFAFLDVDGNGIRESGDSMMEGITVTALGGKTGLVYSTVTKENGLWQLNGLQPDIYTLTFTAPEEYVFTRYSLEGGHDRSILTDESNTGSVEILLKAGGIKDEQNVGFVKAARIAGKVFMDENNNGLMDENEAAVVGAVVELSRANSGEVVAKATTESDGLYRFDCLRTGTYQLGVLLPDDGSFFTNTNASGENANHFAARTGRRESFLTIALEVGQQVSEQVGVLVPSSISGALFVDKNNSGMLDSDEVLLSGITVSLTGGSGTVSKKTVNGAFTFDSLMPGWYTVSADVPEGYVVSDAGDGLYGNKLNENGSTSQFWVAMNTNDTYLPLGIIEPATIIGNVYADEDENGAFNGQDKGTQGVTVRLLNADNTLYAACQTDENGDYVFEGLMPGIYRAEVVLPENCSAVGNDTYSLSQTITLTMGQSYTSRSVGILRYCTVDIAFAYHQNPLKGVQVSFTRADGTAFTQTSNADGRIFTNRLLPGTYEIEVIYPDSLIPSGGLAGITTAEMYQGRMWSVQQETCEPASLQGSVFFDLNDNGKWEEEPGFGGMPLTLLSETGEIKAQTISAEDGSYIFESLLPGNYSLQIDMDDDALGCDQPLQTVSDMTEGEKRTNLSFAVIRYGSVTGQVYLLTAETKEMQTGFAITLTGQTAKGAVEYQAYTNENGAYAIYGLRPGSYTVTAQKPDNRVFLLSGDEDFLGNTSVMTSQSSSDSMALTMGNALQADVGLLIPAKIGDIAFLDNNQNGLYDSATDETIPGLIVRLVKNQEVVAETRTNAYGYYLFENVYPGSYTIEADALDGLDCTQYRTDYLLMASCLISQDGNTVSSGLIYVTSNEKNFNCDLGFVLRENAKKPAQIVPGPGQKWSGD